MITKEDAVGERSSDPRRRAGEEGERQMRFYLRRAFLDAADVHVLNDVRLEDPEHPEADGSPGVCQMDHLVVHRLGMFIIESKSVHGRVRVRDDGSGGDEWTRHDGNATKAIPSPVQQARRQGELLRKYLHRHREQLLGKVPVGLRFITNLVAGTDQRGFRKMPIQVIVAFADHTEIDRVRHWQPPTEPFPTFVCKADQAAEKVRSQVDEHARATRLLTPSAGDHGLWRMSAEEVANVAAFLCEHHVPFSSGRAQDHSPRVARAATAMVEPKVKTTSRPAGDTATEARCKTCGDARLTALWGKFGYYWKCLSCGGNTAMPTTCGVCGAQGHRGQTVRIRKEGPAYFRVCDSCSIEERLWTEPSAALGPRG